MRTDVKKDDRDYLLVVWAGGFACQLLSLILPHN
jgi:hypothetical protein